jgi:hypothetical protein
MRQALKWLPYYQVNVLGVGTQLKYGRNLRKKSKKGGAASAAAPSEMKYG